MRYLDTSDTALDVYKMDLMNHYGEEARFVVMHIPVTSKLLCEIIETVVFAIEGELIGVWIGFSFMITIYLALFVILFAFPGVISSHFFFLILFY